MTRLYNDPTSFTDEMVDGFVAAHGRWVRRVPGGVGRATQVHPGTVAVVTGGGSGHYPAFGGLVGQGLAHGAALGNVFSSPSAQQIYSVARAVERGAGVLLTYGNYTGDVLQFGLAQGRLLGDGIDCQTVTVTDDISSAAPHELQRRRGIAGDLAVFKAAGAAADAGYSLDEVVRVAANANARTRSFGVAFTGCTLPGAKEPLFSVPQGRMGVGMGIHGEPGIGETDVPTADQLAELFVGKLLEEVPSVARQGGRIAVILNGLGAVKYEELFVVYRRVDQLLCRAGLEIVEPEVGELVTSFDMAGASLTLCWLDEELEQFWRAPVDTPAYRKGAVKTSTPVEFASIADPLEAAIPAASAESRSAAVTVQAALTAIHETIDAHADRLGKIDAVAGDGDHGIGMQRGATAALAAATTAVDQGAGTGTALSRAADAWADRAGGTSGALWGVILRSIADYVGDDELPSSARLSAGVGTAAQRVMDLGGARVGDKTLVDVLVPFSQSLQEAVDGGSDLTTAWGIASERAQIAAKGTVDLVPRMGRARSHTVKSVGTPDAGAVSLALITETVHDVLIARRARPKRSKP